MSLCSSVQILVDSKKIVKEEVRSEVRLNEQVKTNENNGRERLN